MPDEALAPEQEGPHYPDVERVRKPQYFKYEKPDVTSTKASIKLTQSDILKAAVQVVRQGGGNNLHSHAAADTCWMVIKGRARFYGEGDVVLGEFGQYEGIMTPRGTQYWFESADENEDLELLQMAAKLRGEKDIRTNHNSRPARMRKQTQHFNAKVNR